jgi:hypothetical protein
MTEAGVSSNLLIADNKNASGKAPVLPRADYKILPGKY